MKLSKKEMIDVIAEVAKGAAYDSISSHPVDIATTMATAAETAGNTIDVLINRSPS